MKTLPAWALLLLSAFALPALAQTNTVDKSGKHGGTVTGSTTQKGNKITAGGTATGPKGNSASGNATATVLPGKVSAQGSVTGPKGGTTTASGSATYSNGTVNGTGTATGPKGNTGSGTVSATQGAATVTGSSGKSKTFQRQPRS